MSDKTLEQQYEEEKAKLQDYFEITNPPPYIEQDSIEGLSWLISSFGEMMSLATKCLQIKLQIKERDNN